MCILKQPEYNASKTRCCSNIEPAALSPLYALFYCPHPILSTPCLPTSLLPCIPFQVSKVRLEYKKYLRQNLLILSVPRIFTKQYCTKTLTGSKGASYVAYRICPLLSVHLMFCLLHYI